MATDTDTAERGGEYAGKGDYHRELDPSWRYYPVYVEKMRRVRAYLEQAGPAKKTIDLGCGEGVLVEQYARRGFDIQGLDYHYASDHVVRGDITALPFAAASYDRVLALDVIEHLDFAQQELALGEIARVLRPDGRALLSLPNLAHLASRVTFLLLGRLIRTSTIERHKGDRPIAEYLALLARHGLEVLSREGIFPTLPVLSALTWASPRHALPLHRLANALHPPAGWCFLNLLEVRRT